MARYAHTVGIPSTDSDPSLTGPQTVQDRGRRKAIGNYPGCGLERAQGVAALGAKPAIRFPDIVALLCQELLQLVALGPAEHPLVPWPGLRKGLAAAQAVTQVHDRHEGSRSPAAPPPRSPRSGRRPSHPS